MVLEARYKAEKIGYPVIGEMAKESSDVIDYNIQEEVTTDASSVFNANNDTTTGMATVIPGVNAPKLIENTSIYQNSEGNTGGANLYNAIRLSYPNNTEAGYRTNWTISDEYGNIKFENSTGPTLQWSGLRIPATGRYSLTITYPRGGSSFKVDVVLSLIKGGYGNDVQIVNHVASYNNTVVTETINYHFNVGDKIAAFCTLHYTGSSDVFSYNGDLTIQITKL